MKNRRAASAVGIFEANQNLELLNLLDKQTKDIEVMFKRRCMQFRAV